MENFATRVYDSKISKKVKEELEIAKIPILYFHQFWTQK